jgi:hypothetical protein
MNFVLFQENKETIDGGYLFLFIDKFLNANIKIFFLVQYSNDIWKNHILTVLITLLKKKYLLLYNKRVIAWILVNIVPRSVSYCTCMLVQNDILLGRIINTVKIWFFHISLLYCTRKNILIFALVQYEFCFISGKQRNNWRWISFFVHR